MSAVLCDSCGKVAPMSCGACKCVSYCSSECQKKTWKYHKHLCKAIVASTKNSSCESSGQSSCVLILDGMGALGSEDYNTEPIYQELTLQHGMHVSIVHLDNNFVSPSQIAVALEKGNFSTCIILGWGSGDNDVEKNYNTDNAFRTGLVAWVTRGGCLIVQGERISHAGGDWPQWFGLDWKSSDYCRTTHVLNATHWFTKLKNHSLCPAMNVKACLVTNVTPQDRLYSAEDGAVTSSLVPGFGGNPVSTGQVAIALGRCGAGTVSFYGDVNIEKETITTIGMIAKYAVSATVI
jgi:hypothetical protein